MDFAGAPMHRSGSMLALRVYKGPLKRFLYFSRFLNFILLPSLGPSAGVRDCIESDSALGATGVFALRDYLESDSVLCAKGFSRFETASRAILRVRQSGFDAAGVPRERFCAFARVVLTPQVYPVSDSARSPEWF